MTEQLPPLLLGLTGYPLGYSHSPTIHRAALEASGLVGSYELFPIPALPEGGAALQALLDRVRSGEIRGLNVTIPHKEAVIPMLDRLSDAAGRIGAVNTIFVEGQRLTGDNTDGMAFRRVISRVFSLTPGRALVLGAGGGARAVVYALRTAGWEVRVSARRQEQSARLAADFNLGGSATLVWPLTQKAIKKANPQLIVNTTPLGMTPDVDGSPWPDGLAFPARACVYDLVYNPRETRLLRTARASKLKTADGLDMLVEQAALSFEVWTGRTAPRAEMLLSVS